MQTRKELFDAQPFHVQWNKTLGLVEKIDLPLGASSNFIQNFARLKKAITYLKQLINSADIDLIPSSVWQNFQSPCQSISGQLEAYLSNQQEGYIDTSNTQIDLLLQYLSPYVITGKGAAQAAGRALSTYGTTIKKHTDVLEAKIAETLKKSENAESSIAGVLEKVEELEGKLVAYQTNLLSDDEDSQSIKTTISGYLEDIESSRQEIVEFRDKLVGASDDEEGNESIISEVEANKEKISDDSQEASKNLESINTIIKDLKITHTLIVGSANEDGELVGGLKAEYEAHKQRLNQYNKKQKETHSAILEQIKGLLPSATSAGLASSFATQKKAYEKPIKTFGRLFYFAIFGLFCVAVSSIFMRSGLDSGDGSQYVWVKRWSDVIASIVARAPIALPFVWLAYFSGKRRNENRRLEEEYAHKETIARSYYSFKEQVGKLDEEDSSALSAKLLEAAITSVSFNASSTLDKEHDDKLPSPDQVSELQRVLNSFQNILPRI